MFKCFKRANKRAPDGAAQPQDGNCGIESTPTHNLRATEQVHDRNKTLVIERPSSSPPDEQNEYAYSTGTPASDLVIAIDFGTTFSGVAYAHSAAMGTATYSNQMVESVKVVKAWPGPTIDYREKTPTVLSYQCTPPAGAEELNHPMIPLLGTSSLASRKTLWLNTRHPPVWFPF